MSAPKISLFRATRLLARLHRLRLINPFGIRAETRPAGTATGPRAASAGKPKLGWGLSLTLGMVMLLSFTFMASGTVDSLVKTYGTERVETPPSAAPLARQPSRPAVVLPPAAGSRFALPVLQAAGMMGLLLILTAVIIGMAAIPLGDTDLELEWLATLPVPLTTVVLSRIAARAMIAPMSLMLILAFMVMLAWRAGFSWWSIPLALVTSLSLMAIAAAVQGLLETWFRASFSAPALRNIQAAFSIASFFSMMVVFIPTVGIGHSVMSLSRSLPEAALLTPPGLAVLAASADSLPGLFTWLGLLLAETAAILGLCTVLSLRPLRDGIDGGGARESGRKTKSADGAERTKRPAQARPSLLTAVQHKELTLLRRDRNFLVQTLVLPAMIVVMQLGNAGGVSGAFASLAASPATAAAVAFGIGSYALMFSAFQTLNSEGRALWLLYCLPYDLERVLRQKAMLWSGLALVFTIALLAAFAFAGKGSWLTLAELGLVAIIGIPIFAVTATALGVFASDPLAEAVQRKVNLGHTYLYMTLAGGYIFALMSDDRLQRLVMVILLAMLALALWQKARDHLPYLLDPVAAPPSRVSAADGLIALVLFFMLQIALLVLLSNGKPVVLGLPLLMSFVVAGAVTACVMIFAFKYFDTQGLPVLAGPRVWRGIGLGILAGLIAAGLAGVYLYMIPAEWLAAHQHGPKPSMFGLTLFAILAICAAPPIEEFIFRGLLFTGLERSWGGAVAIVASAALFAIVHPPVGMIPVFELGLATAIVYHYTKQLAAPIATHAAYNAVIVGAQFVA